MNITSDLGHLWVTDSMNVTSDFHRPQASEPTPRRNASTVWESHEMVAYVEKYYYLGLLVVGTIGNLLCLAVLSRKTFRRSPIGIYLRFLTLADLMALYTGALYYTTRALFGLNFRKVDELSCKFHIWLSFIACDLSSWALVLVSTARLISIVWPMRHLITRRRVYLSLLVTVTIILAVNLPMFIIYGNVPDPARNRTKLCVITTDSYRNFYVHIFSWVVLLKFNFLPCVLLIVLNSALVTSVYRSGKAVSEMEARPSTSSLMAAKSIKWGLAKWRLKLCSGHSRRFTQEMGTGESWASRESKCSQDGLAANKYNTRTQRNGTRIGILGNILVCLKLADESRKDLRSTLADESRKDLRSTLADESRKDLRTTLADESRKDLRSTLADESRKDLKSTLADESRKDLKSTLADEEKLESSLSDLKMTDSKVKNASRSCSVCLCSGKRSSITPPAEKREMNGADTSCKRSYHPSHDPGHGDSSSTSWAAVLCDNSLEQVREVKIDVASLGTPRSGRQVPSQVHLIGAALQLSSLEDSTHAEADIDTRTDIAADIDTRTDIDADIDTRTDIDAVIDTRTDIAADIDTRTDIAADIDTRTDIGADIDTRTDIDAVIDTRTDLDAVIDTRTDIAADIDTRTDLGADIDTRTDIAAVIDSQADIIIGPVSLNIEPQTYLATNSTFEITDIRPNIDIPISRASDSSPQTDIPISRALDSSPQTDIPISHIKSRHCDADVLNVSANDSVDDVSNKTESAGFPVREAPSPKHPSAPFSNGKNFAADSLTRPDTTMNTSKGFIINNISPENDEPNINVGHDPGKFLHILNCAANKSPRHNAPAETIKSGAEDNSSLTSDDTNSVASRGGLTCDSETGGGTSNLGQERVKPNGSSSTRLQVFSNKRRETNTGQAASSTISRSRSLTKTLLVLNTVFLVSTTPITVYMTGKSYFWPDTSVYSVSLDITATVANFTMYTNNGINFILYCVTGSKFRGQLLLMFKEFFDVVRRLYRTCVSRG